jgi:hypothetical protein
VDGTGNPPFDPAMSARHQSVEGILGLPVHQEDFAGWSDAESLPDTQRPASPIPLERLAQRDSVDGDGAIRAADGLSWMGNDALQERHAFGQITATGKEAH